MLDPEGEDVFEYDALDRLKKATRKVNGVVTEVDEYDYNALGALKKNANVLLDHQRARIGGGCYADAAVPATVGGQPIVLDGAGRITSMRGVTFGWSRDTWLFTVQEPSPAPLEKYGVDPNMRRSIKIRGTQGEFYFYEGMNRVATLDSAGALTYGYLFDGIDHPLRIKVPATSTLAYYELDLAGNVRRLRASGGGDLGGYRFTAFGQTKEDTSTLAQPLRWKARWHQTLNGFEFYDVRARQWAPEIGAFVSIDNYRHAHISSTLWGWPGMNPMMWSDPLGRDNPGAATQVARAAATPSAPSTAGSGGAFAGAGVGGFFLGLFFGPLTSASWDIWNSGTPDDEGPNEGGAPDPDNGPDAGPAPGPGPGPGPGPAPPSSPPPPGPGDPGGPRDFPECSGPGTRSHPFLVLQCCKEKCRERTAQCGRGGPYGSDTQRAMNDCVKQCVAENRP